MKKIVGLVALLSFVSSNAMSPANSGCSPCDDVAKVLAFLTKQQCEYLSGPGNTFDGQSIDPANTLELLAQVPSKTKRGKAADFEQTVLPVKPLTKAERKAVRNFITDNNLAGLLSGADYQHTVFCGDLDARKEVQAAIDAQLADKNIENRAVNSFVFEVPGTNLIIKKSMIPLSRQNIVQTSAENKWEGPAWNYMRMLSEDEFCRWRTELDGRTYQNTSRAMVYLRALEAVNALGIADVVTIPDTFLVHIPGRPKVLDDTNYMQVERSVGTNLQNWDTSELAIDEATILAMVKLTAATGFWTMKDASSVVDGKVVYYDLELPNSHNITKVLHKDTDHFRALVKIGWKELEDQIINVYLQTHPENQEVVNALLEKKHALEKEIMSCWK